MCQNVAGISDISQFHEVFGSNFWRIFAVWSNCAAPPLRPPVASVHQQREPVQQAQQLNTVLSLPTSLCSDSGHGRRTVVSNPPKISSHDVISRFLKFTPFPFPVIVFAPYSKFVKLLQA
jgi:hypothetical protein